jgi:hypothetical protein
VTTWAMVRGKILRSGLGIRALSLLSLCLIASRGDAGAGGGGGGRGGGGGEEEDPVAVSNHFYVMARSYETRGEMLSAMRVICHSTRGVHFAGNSHSIMQQGEGERERER